jgi:hypothetical protein
MPSSTRTKVYFVENTETGRIKVGFTTGLVVRRLRALQTGSDSELRLLGVVPADPDTGTAEAQLHRKFSRWRYRGEWFTRDILPLVKAILESQ